MLALQNSAPGHGPMLHSIGEDAYDAFNDDDYDDELPSFSLDDDVSDAASDAEHESEDGDELEDEAPFVMMPRLDPHSNLLAGWTESTGSSAFSPLESFNEKLMLPPGGVIKGPWTREVCALSFDSM